MSKLDIQGRISVIICIKEKKKYTWKMFGTNMHNIVHHFINNNMNFFLFITIIEVVH